METIKEEKIEELLEETKADEQSTPVDDTNPAESPKPPDSPKPAVAEPDENDHLPKVIDREIDIHTKWLDIEKAIYKRKSRSQRRRYDRDKVIRQLPTNENRIFPLFCTDQIVETESFSNFEIGQQYIKPTPPPKTCCPTVSIVQEMKNTFFIQTLEMRELLIYLIYMVLLMSVISSSMLVSKKSELFQVPKGLLESIELLSTNEPLNDRSHLRTVYNVREKIDLIMYINKTFLSSNWLKRYYGEPSYPMDIVPFVRIIGIIRIRTINVRNDPCKFLPIAKHFIESGERSECFPIYHELYENRSQVKMKYVHNQWRINESISYNYTYGGPYSAHYKTNFFNYGPGGYILKLKRGREGKKNALKAFWQWKIMSFINNSTRVVAVEYTFIDVWTSLLGQVKVWFELLASGAIQPHLDIRIAKIFQLWNKHDCFMLGLFFCVVIISIYYCLNAIREAFYIGIKYFKRVTTWIEFGMSMSTFAALHYEMSKLAIIRDVMDMYFEKPNEYYEVDEVIQMQLSFETWLMTAVCFGFLKCITYLEVIGNFDLYGRTLRYNVLPFVTILMIFAFLFSALSTFAIITFGRYNMYYFSYVQVFYVHMQRIMGHSSFPKDLININPILGVCCYFVSLYLMIAYLFLFLHTTLYNSYHRSEAESLLRRGWSLGKIFRMTIKALCESKNKPRSHITRQEIRDALRLCFFTEPEIDLFFMNYNVYEKQTNDPFEICLRLLDLKGYDRDMYRKHLILKPYDDLTNRSNRKGHGQIIHEFHEDERKKNIEQKDEMLKVKHLRKLQQQIHETEVVCKFAGHRIDTFYSEVHALKGKLIREYNRRVHDATYKM